MYVAFENHSNPSVVSQLPKKPTVLLGITGRVVVQHLPPLLLSLGATSPRTLAGRRIFVDLKTEDEVYLKRSACCVQSMTCCIRTCAKVVPGATFVD